MRVHVQLLDSFPHELDLPPFRTQHADDAGYDLYATEDLLLYPGQRYAMGTGIAVALAPPEIQEYQAYGMGLGKPRTVFHQQTAVMRLVPRSGLAIKRGLSIVNTPGTIDAGYRGEIKVILLNTNAALDYRALEAMAIRKEDSLPEALDILLGGMESNAIEIKRGDRICQAIFEWAVQPTFEAVAELPATSRGAGGLGSTG
jgi:dUTP pyrophosphatase